MLITFDTFKAKYPTLPSLDFIQDSYFSIHYWSSTVFAAMVEDAEDYNSSYKTEDGKFWSVITVTNADVMGQLWDDEFDEYTGVYWVNLKGCEDFTYQVALNDLEACKSLIDKLTNLGPLTLEKIKALGF